MAATSRPPFQPVDTAFDPVANAQRDDVESPSLSNSNALARFEFEPGRSKDGTKVLMVEWEDDSTTKDLTEDWEISWETQRTVLPARDQEQARLEDSPVNRLYFLLGPGISIPTAVTLRKGNVSWRTNPLPAIFPPELGATGREAGKKGVLHTIWAKKRLQVLQQEIEADKNNADALSERDWIEQNFGVVTRISMPAIVSGGLHSPTSPRTPGGGRLMDKLKGLKLGTSIQDLEGDGLPKPSNNPLSPESSDVALGSNFSSFAALKGVPPPSTLAAKLPQAPSTGSAEPLTRRITAQRPPESFLAHQQQAAGMGSLNASLAGNDLEAVSSNRKEDDDDDLFALPMSPRSPEMTKSPFTFAAQDTMRYLQGEKA